MMVTIDDELVVDEMKKNGGEFIRRLAHAFLAADPENRGLIKATWPDHWTAYRDCAIEVRKNRIQKEAQISLKHEIESGWSDGGRRDVLIQTETEQITFHQVITKINDNDMVLQWVNNVRGFHQPTGNTRVVEVPVKK